MTAPRSRWRKLAADYDLHDRTAAMGFLQHHAAKGQIVTGLLYMEKDSGDLHKHLHTVDVPLNSLGERELCRGKAHSTSSTQVCARRHRLLLPRLPGLALELFLIPVRGQRTPGFQEALEAR